MRKLAAYMILVSVASAANADESRRPNIIFILADDLGWTDVGCYGSGYYETPNIDRMAAEGLRFTDGYTCASNCQPTRAALISGQYGPRTGVYTVGSIDRFDWRSRPLRPVDNAQQLPKDVVTIADSMKSAGYATGMFGKWHLGDGEDHPSQRGFDEAIVSAGKHFGFETDPPAEHPEGQYLADFLTDRAVDFIERHQGEPFFLYLPHFGVHSPYQAKKDLIRHYQEKPGVDGHDDPTYAAMIASVDQSVGRVLETLDKLGLAENTLVIFSSDNGGVGSYKAAGIDKDGVTSNDPLKGGKGTFAEGGIRVPYVFRHKGVIEPGRETATPIISVDLYPTLLELAGGDAPADQPLDGVSYAKILTGEADRLQRDALYWHFPGYLGASGDQWRTTPVSVIRSGPWKLTEYLEDGRLSLYNLDDDLSEKHDLARSNPDKAEELHNQLVAWRKAIEAPMPTANQPKQAKGGQDKNKARKKGKRRQQRAEAAG